LTQSAQPPRPGTPEADTWRTLVRGGLAASAPAVVALAGLISASSVGLLNTFGLGRLGVAAAGVLSVCLGWLLAKGRWWAGVPTLAAAAAGAVVFSYKFARPFAAYLSANPVQGLGDLTSPLVMLSPALVVVVLCVGLCLAVFKGVRAAREVGPRPVGRAAWGVLLVWLVLLAGDAAYQHWGWRAVQAPSDLVVRLCSDRPAVAAQARRLLLAQGEEAVPALLEGMASGDSGLGCLRRGSAEVLSDLGPAAVPGLLEAAREGSRAALDGLQAVGDPRAAAPLLEIYRTPDPERDVQFELELKNTIRQLNPTLRLAPG
jgi:hypothetical protein